MQFHRPISCATLRACNEHIESHARHPWGLCPTMGTSHSSSHSDTSNGCNFLGHIGIEQHASNQSLLVSIFCINSWLELKSSYICNMSTSRMWPWSLPGDLTMVNPRVDDREYDSVGCFFLRTPQKIHLHVFQVQVFNLILMLWLPTWPVMRGCNAARWFMRGCHWICPGHWPGSRGVDPVVMLHISLGLTVVRSHCDATNFRSLKAEKLKCT